MGNFHGSWTFWAVGLCQCWFHRIRSVPANSYDSTYCSVLGQMAVHGAMAGYSGITVSWTDSSSTCHPKKSEAYKMVDVIILRFHDGVEATVCSLQKLRSCFWVNPCITTLNGQRIKRVHSFTHVSDRLVRSIRVTWPNYFVSFQKQLFGRTSSPNTVVDLGDFANRITSYAVYLHFSPVLAVLCEAIATCQSMRLPIRRVNASWQIMRRNKQERWLCRFTLGNVLTFFQDLQRCKLIELGTMDVGIGLAMIRPLRPYGEKDANVKPSRGAYSLTSWQHRQSLASMPQVWTPRAAGSSVCRKLPSNQIFVRKLSQWSSFHSCDAFEHQRFYLYGVAGVWLVNRSRCSQQCSGIRKQCW